MVASRKTGTVNLVVSRKSGGAVRAPGNAGDKRVQRKRGRRSVAAVATRIERGYLKRIRTAGSTACVDNHVDSRGTGTDGSGHPAAERTSTTARYGGDDTRTRKRKTRTASAEHDRHARTARAGRSGRYTGDWQARPVRRRSDEIRGLVVQIEIVSRSRGPAVSARVDDDRDIVDTDELNATLGSEESALSTQMYYILVMTTAGAALDKCHNARVNEGFEAWRQFVMEWEPKLRTRFVGLLQTTFITSWRRSRGSYTTTRTNPQRP